VVFKLSPGGAETVLHSFTGTDRARPIAGLIADRAGGVNPQAGLGLIADRAGNLYQWRRVE
jgi:hypothetical protein